MTHALGQKRQCSACTRLFYDLNRSPATCPSCGALHEEKIPQQNDEVSALPYEETDAFDEELFLDELG